MLRIRVEQMKALACLDFEDAAIARARLGFARHIEIAGEPGAREAARLALDRARSHGLLAERSAFVYLDLMFLLGSHFDTDPQLPWARSILADPSIDLELGRVDFLSDRAGLFLDAVAADFTATGGRSPVLAVCGESMVEPNERLNEILGVADRTPWSAWLTGAFPRKCALVGAEGVDGVVERAAASAREHGCLTRRGVLLHAVFTMALGHGYADDPLLPWMSAALAADGLGPVERVDHLERCFLETARRFTRE